MHIGHGALRRCGRVSDDREVIGKLVPDADLGQYVVSATIEAVKP